MDSDLGTNASGDLLDLDSLVPGLSLVPVVHGSLPFAEAARRAALSRRWDAIAIDLPYQVHEEFLEAVVRLPEIWAATWIQDNRRWVLPADPCGAATLVARAALQERIPLVFVDDASPTDERDDPPLPDPAACESIGAADYLGIGLPFLDRHPDQELSDRAARIAARLRRVSGKVLLVCRMALVPHLLRELASPPRSIPAEGHPEITDLETVPVDPRHIAFCLGEWPFVAQEAERIRRDPFAEMPPHRAWTMRVLSAARRRHLDRRRARFLPVHELRSADRFAHRLARLSGHHQPSMWDLVQAARGCSGDSFAAAVLEAARHHGHLPEGPLLKLGPHNSRLEEGPVMPWIHRLSPMPAHWTTVQLRKDPPPEEALRWIREWKPASLCSHLPEDLAIEHFNQELRERAKSSSPSSQARSAPFESSLLDGLDLRETIRHFWKGEIWVREFPPRTLKLDTVVIAFDDGNSDRYPHQGTWYAEHANESTLLFYATDPAMDPIGPGILRCRYGGLALLFPPRAVPDVFAMRPPPLEARTPLETLVAGACLYAKEKAVVFASWDPPSLALSRIAHEAGKRLVHVKLAGFSARTLEKLRTFHVLNGKDVRGWADRFIQG
jgi:hypothetical protein